MISWHAINAKHKGYTLKRAHSQSTLEELMQHAMPHPASPPAFGFMAVQNTQHQEDYLLSSYATLMHLLPVPCQACWQLKQSLQSNSSGTHTPRPSWHLSGNASQCCPLEANTPTAAPAAAKLRSNRQMHALHAEQPACSGKSWLVQSPQPRTDQLHLRWQSMDPTSKQPPQGMAQ